MLTKGAITDLIASHLARAAGGGSPSPAPSRKVPEELPKKVFFSDYELRRLLSPDGKSVQVPANALLSPLALDWIEFNCIQVIRAGAHAAPATGGKK